MAMATVTTGGISGSLTRHGLPPSLPSSSLSSTPAGHGAAAAAFLHRSGRLLSSGAVPGMQVCERRDARKGHTSRMALGAVPDHHALGSLDPHSIPFLADVLNFHWFSDWINRPPVLDPSKLPVRIELDPTREILEERPNLRLSEEFMRNFYMTWAFVFSWGCCVFGSMKDEFYESDTYRNAGGNGSGHWIYDQQDREERAAREELWSEELMKEIEEKAEEVRRAEEEQKKKLEVV